MRNHTVFWLFLIILVGLAMRLFLATLPNNPANNDMLNILKITRFIQNGQNVYLSIGQDNFGYNSGPGFFILVGYLIKLQKILPMLSFTFIYKAFLSLIDLLTLIVLIGIARQKKISVVKTSALFFLNPVSIIISGFHGHFNNIAILLLLSAVLIYQNTSLKLKNILVWLCLTTGLITMHLIVVQVLMFFLSQVKNQVKAALFFISSVLTFLLSIFPYTHENYGRIIKLILVYGGVPGLYGISYVLFEVYKFLFKPQNMCFNCYSLVPHVQFSGIVQLLTYTFVFLYFIFAVFIVKKNIDLARALLISFLFFLTFSTGIGAYFILPVALGALYPTRWFLLYSLAALLYYLGSNYVFNIPVFNVVPLNIIWIFSALWFFSECKRTKILFVRKD